MNEIKAAIYVIVGLFVLLAVVLVSNKPDATPQSIAEACKKQFPYSQQEAARCEFMTTGTIALEQADQRDADRQAKIDAVVRQSR